MVGGGNDDGIELFADLIEHDSIVSEGGRFIRIAIVLFQITLHFSVLLFVGVHEGHDIVLAGIDQPVEVTHGPAPASDQSTIEFSARIVGGKDIGSLEQIKSRKATGGESGAFEE